MKGAVMFSEQVSEFVLAQSSVTDKSSEADA
jgi:hypothetical protein